MLQEILDSNVGSQTVSTLTKFLNSKATEDNAERIESHNSKSSSIYYYGVRQLVGTEPEANIWGAAEDAIAALKGAFGGLTE